MARRYAPALGLAIAGGALAVLGIGVPSFGLFALLAAATIVLGAEVSFLHAWRRRWTTEIAVTNRRVILKRGFDVSKVIWNQISDLNARFPPI